MSRLIWRILSVPGLAFLTVFTFFWGQLPLIEGKHLIDKYIDTEFAENYSPEKFEQVKVGMHFWEVEEILGQPLYTGRSSMGSLNTSYYYTDDGKLFHQAKDHGQHGYDDFAWYRSTVEVNAENVVVSIDKGWSYD